VNRTFLLIRAIRGPLLLIALGVLLLLQRFTDFGFERSWPILVILFGVLKLAERAALHAVSTSGGPGQTPPAGGSWT
jgi:hypothetical protein